MPGAFKTEVFMAPLSSKSFMFIVDGYGLDCGSNCSVIISSFDWRFDDVGAVSLTGYTLYFGLFIGKLNRHGV